MDIFTIALIALVASIIMTTVSAIFGFDYSAEFFAVLTGLAIIAFIISFIAEPVKFEVIRYPKSDIVVTRVDSTYRTLILTRDGKLINSDDTKTFINCDKIDSLHYYLSYSRVGKLVESNYTLYFRE